MNGKILVDRGGVIMLSPLFLLKCKETFEISLENLISYKIKSFSFGDIELIECPKDNITGTEFAEALEKNGMTPLNAHHANAIFMNKHHIEELQEMLIPFLRRKDFKLETVNFFGSLATDGTEGNNVYCFKYENFFATPLFMAFENEPGWSTGKDLALVFKDKFLRSKNK